MLGERVRTVERAFGVGGRSTRLLLLASSCVALDARFDEAVQDLDDDAALLLGDRRKSGRGGPAAKSSQT